MGTHVDDTHPSEMMTAELSSVIPGWQEGIPLIRLFACGPFTIEVLQDVQGGDATQARYMPLPPERLHGRGPAPALTFLKLLTSQRDRYAPKDWLIEHLRGDEYLITPKRLENIVSFVRQLLSLPDGTRPTGMLRYVRASHESGDGYRLAPYPLIWLDVDAIAATVRQACLLERFGDDALPSWERAYQLASRGTYLAEEPYSEWAEARREEVEGHLRQCVHALSRLWLARYGATAEEEVLHLLRSYWPRHPEDEDVAWGLMDLLGRRGRYQEALEVYARLEQNLEEEGLTKDGKQRVPDQRTRDLADYLRLKERQPLINRPPQRLSQEQPKMSLLLSQTGSAVQDLLSSLALFLQAQGQGMRATNVAQVNEQQRAAVRLRLPHILDPLTVATRASWDESAPGTWLALGVSDLAVLFEQGWTTESILAALQVVLQAIQDMPLVVRQKLLQLSDASLIHGTALLPEEQTQLCVSLGQSISESWKLFHTSKPSSMLAIAQAQLALVERLHVLLYPTVRPFFYAALYQLIGAALYLLGSFEQAQHALEQSYLAGLQTANAWHMAQSLSWQAYLWHARGESSHALTTIEQALRLISFQDDLECLRLRARLLALGSEYLALEGDASTAHEQLAASQALLSALSEPHEEFDVTSWLQQAGICAFHLHDYPLAIQRLERAFDELPSQWRLRSLATAIPLAKALTRAKKAGRAIEVAQRAISLVTSIGASVLTQQFVTYLEQDLLAHFPDDKRCQTLVIEARQQLERQPASH